MDPSLQMRGQSPMNCPVSDVKMWGQNLTYCLMTKEKAALIHTLMLLLTNTKLQRTFQYTRKIILFAQIIGGEISKGQMPVYL